MPTFDQWMKQWDQPKKVEPQSITPHKKTLEQLKDEYPYLILIGRVYHYPCCMCEEYSEVYCDIDDFEPDMHYCGGSPRCCP